MRRADGYGDNGTPWQAGATRARVARPRRAARQRAVDAPSLDGTSRVAPHCVAFVSAASNLVRGDTNGKPDAFLYDLRSGSLRRVSVNSRGRQSNGTVSEVVVNGLCTRVAFVSDAADLALRRTSNRSWRTAVTRANPPGRRQVYVRAIGGTNGIDRALKGLTFLASATDRGRPGDGDSHSIAFTHNADTRALTFASDARNLSSRDRNGVTDVYQRVMTRRYGPQGPRPPPTAAAHGHQPRLRRRGRPRRLGPVDLAGEQRRRLDGRVRHDRRRPHRPRDRRAPDRHGAAWTAAGRRPCGSASRNPGGGPGNGPSAAPSLTAGGSWVVFDSEATDVGQTTTRGPDTNGVRDAMLATEPSGDRWLLGERGAREPTTNPMTSPHGNYVVFERGGHVHLLYVGEK